MRDYKDLYRKSLKVRRKLTKKYEMISEELFQIECELSRLNGKFETEVTNKVDLYVRNYEGWLKEEVSRWQHHYHQANKIRGQREDEIERLRNGEKT